VPVRSHRAPSEEFRLPGYALCSPSPHTPPARTETRQAAAIRQVRAKLCENYLRGDRAEYVDQMRAMAREIPTRWNRENAGGLGENPLALTIPYVARLLDNFAGELSCLRSRQRLRQQEG
jgi:hypothetical protein